MNHRRLPRSLVIALRLAGVAAYAAIGAAQTPSATASPGGPLIAAFKSTYAASASDAVEIVTGKDGTMCYDMKLMSGTNMVGRAATSLARPAPADQTTRTLTVKHAVEV